MHIAVRRRTALFALFYFVTLIREWAVIRMHKTRHHLFRLSLYNSPTQEGGWLFREKTDLPVAGATSRNVCSLLCC